MAKETHFVSREDRVIHSNYGYLAGVRDDRDGLDLCELFYRDDEKTEVEKSFTVPWDMARKMAKIILERSND